MKTPKMSGLIEQIPRAQRLLFLSILLCAVTAGVGFSAIYTPWQRQHQELEHRYSDEEQRANLLLTINRQGRQLKRQEKELLLETGGTSDLTGEVSRIASKSGIHIESVIPQNEIFFDPYTKFQIQILAASSFPDLVGFLQMVEKEIPILQVDQVDIMSLAQQSKNGMEPIPPDRQKTKLLISGFAKRGPSR